MKYTTILIAVLLLISCKAPEARKPESIKSGSFYKESAERNKKLNAKEYEKIKSIIALNPQNVYLASKSGFWYTYINKVEIDTITPRFGDIVEYAYDVKDLDGNIIYTKEELGPQTYIIDRQEVFTGLREGLKLMKPKETVNFLFPSQKAYGYYGDKNKIGTNIPLLVKVTLNSITQKTEN